VYEPSDVVDVRSNKRESGNGGWRASITAVTYVVVVVSGSVTEEPDRIRNLLAPRSRRTAILDWSPYRPANDARPASESTTPRDYPP
jgi:hypothetical protein